MRTGFALSLALGLLSATVFAAPDLAHRAAVEEAVRWGRAMHEHDVAASNATDLAMANENAAHDTRVRGWVTEPSKDGIHVVFVGDVGGKPMALYEVTPPAASSFIAHAAGRALTPVESGAFAARQAAIAALPSRCADNINTIVLPDSADGKPRWRVYLAPGTRDAAVVPLGGYFRFDVSEDGQKVLSQRPFTKACMNMHRENNAAGLFITHLLDPQPTEVHVFASLTYGLPIYVATMPDGAMWKVEGDRIVAIDRKAPSK
jgi:hypothetical protein